MSNFFDPAQDALNRMQRAYKRGTGCYLTADMIASLGLTTVGSLWDEPDPRCAKCHGEGFINRHANLPDEPCPKCRGQKLPSQTRGTP